MTTNAPDNLTNNQTPQSDLPWQSKTSNVVEPLNMGLPVSNLPTTNVPPVIPSVDTLIAVPADLPVAPSVATPIPTPVAPPVATPVDMPIQMNPVPVQSNVVQAPEESKELPGKVLPPSPLTEKITPVVNIPVQVVVPEQKKDTTPAEPVAENKKRVKNIIIIVVGLIAGVSVLLLGIYFASNAS